jgi:hypothetical protein
MSSVNNNTSTSTGKKMEDQRTTAGKDGGMKLPFQQASELGLPKVTPFKDKRTATTTGTTGTVSMEGYVEPNPKDIEDIIEIDSESEYEIENLVESSGDDNRNKRHTRYKQ